MIFYSMPSKLQIVFGIFFSYQILKLYVNTLNINILNNNKYAYSYKYKHIYTKT